MRVLHVIPSVAPRYGGPSRAVIEMCRALRQDGVDTLIATTDADGGGHLSVELGRPVSFSDVPAIFFPRQWSEAYKYSRPLARWLEENVRDFDVVHIHAVFSHACLTASRACRHHGVPYVVRPLGTLDPWSLRQKRFRKRVFWYLGVRRMLMRAATIHYTTQSERELVAESFELERGTVIPLGVEERLLAVTKAAENSTVEAESFDGHPYALVLSRLHRKKGLELLLPAFLSLVKRPEFAEWRLVLAGDGDAGYVASLRQLAQAGAGNGHVIFAGWLGGARRQAVLQQSSLLALTSYQENFGLCAIEALACGVPVLISPQVNLAPEIEAAGAGWVVPLEQTALENALAEILRDAPARARRGAVGRELVRRRFVWDAIAAELEALYVSVKPTASAQTRDSLVS